MGESSRVDWQAVARLLAERVSRAAVVLDAQGTIRLLNAEMEGLLERERFYVEGQPWAALFDVNSTHSSEWLTRALDGSLRMHHAEAKVSPTRSVQFEFDVAQVGTGATPALLLVESFHQISDSMQPASADAPLEYEIEASVDSFGTLVGVTRQGKPVQGNVGRHCFRLFHSRDIPCEECPVRLPNSVPWPRTSIRHRVGEGTFEVVQAEWGEHNRARLRIISIAETTLQAIHRSKLKALSVKGELSERESEVLQHLLSGRSVEEIAELLAVAPRTVKYHQANLLAKLGADSRIDLLRLLF
ncbi:MAG TPA: helix-turn-helix transcriptional regulator [Polyangiaceae bacterium]|nr:helix-turn-helix transcriptional regulator [Polyangiaceae bacterium]